MKTFQCLLSEGEERVLRKQESWCHGLYDEVLAGSFINGHSTELLCHNRDTGEYSCECNLFPYFHLPVCHNILSNTLKILL